MLQSQKMKCLVLSRYRHSDSPIIASSLQRPFSSVPKVAVVERSTVFQLRLLQHWPRHAGYKGNVFIYAYFYTSRPRLPDLPTGVGWSPDGDKTCFSISTVTSVTNSVIKTLFPISTHLQYRSLSRHISTFPHFHSLLRSKVFIQQIH